MAEQERVLVVEDDRDQRGALREALEVSGRRVIEAESIELGWRFFTQHRPDLAVLDVRLPDGSGVELCRKIRAHAELAATPVIMLTGEAAFETKEAGFRAGADQYLVKPVKAQEVLLWVDALLRRHDYYRTQEDKVTAGKLVIDVKARLIRYGELSIDRLTAREFDLLYHLVKNRPQVFSRDTILKRIWKTVAVDNLVDVHVSNLRRKLPPAVSDSLQNVPGKGFRFLEQA